MRIVVAEDLYLLRDGMVRLIEAYGHQVVATAATGPETLEALLASRGLWPSPVKSSSSSDRSATPPAPPVAGKEAASPELFELDGAESAVQSV